MFISQHRENGSRARRIRASTAPLIALVAGCSSYVTPGGPVSMDSLTKVDGDIAERMKLEPRAVFPARIAVARVQGPDYRSYRCDGYGGGRYCVVTTRDIEKEDD
jgi:hypothetical protein